MVRIEVFLFFVLFCYPGAGEAERWRHPWERGAALLQLQALPGLEGGISHPGGSYKVGAVLETLHR